MRHRIFKRGIVILILLVLVFSLSACDKLGKGAKTDEKSGFSAEQVYSGTKGIEMKFIENVPPDRVYDRDDLYMSLEVKNMGARPLKGDIYLSGIDPAIIDIGEVRRDFSGSSGALEPKSRFVTEGEMTTIDYSGSINLPEGTETYKPNLIVTACYQYETLATPLVCINPDVRNILEQKAACKTAPVSMSGGQGAPIAVTKVDVESTGRNIYFKIHVKNAADGQVIKGQRSCPFNLEYQDLNKVTYDVDLQGARQIKCSPSLGGYPEIRLTNGEGTITCNFEIPQQNKFAYQSPLLITLNYGYMESIQKQIEVVRID